MFIVCTPAFVFLVLFSSLPCLKRDPPSSTRKAAGNAGCAELAGLERLDGRRDPTDDPRGDLAAPKRHRCRRGEGLTTSCFLSSRKVRVVFPKVEIGSSLGKICICSGHSKLMHSSK